MLKTITLCPNRVTHNVKGLKAHQLTVEEIAADTVTAAARRCRPDHHITAYIPNFGQYKADRPGFTFNQPGNYYQCQRGVQLPYKRTYQDNKGYYKKQYRSSARDCGGCPLRSTCIGGRADYKKIEESIDKPLYDEMHQRLQTGKAKWMKKLRQYRVDPVLGTLVNFTGIRRVWVRGLAAANKCMLGASIAYNLKKWLNYRQPNRRTALLALQKAKKGLPLKLLELNGCQRCYTRHRESVGILVNR